VTATLAFFANGNWDAREGAFAGATTNGAGSGSLAVTLRTQKSVWHPIHSLFDINDTAFAENLQRERPRVEDANSLSLHSISLGAAEYGIGEVRASCVGAGQIRIGQIRTCEVRVAQIGCVEIST
jgi:hypothetical protein